MHLKQLILAGFKSFVDLTKVHIPGQLVGVVGPNGCGKSNIIDAVRWVMGESSAKNLRGESMSDVIFNGSSNRKRVGQASVELIFDNSLGRIIGPFASYNEISVKRVVTRDGDSQYFLNNSRCRRKDITDIFLGTGTGPRSYSIIGQGTISQLIEAKPDDLRVFLEEAAGVSKYKERRKETLSRIEHTRDNLTRVADIRDELDKQLQRLGRQAKAAERYTQLKEQEHLCRVQILALKWQDFTQLQVAKQNEIQTLTVNLEQQQSLLTSVNKERTLLGEQINELSNQSETIQAQRYQVGTEIARLEQTIQQQEREQKRLQEERQQMQEDWQFAQQQIKLDIESLEQCRTVVKEMDAQLQQLKKSCQEQEALWQQTQHKQLDLENQWQQVHDDVNTLKREIDLTTLNLQHCQQSKTNVNLRFEKIKKEQEAVSLTDLQQEREQLQEQQLKLQQTQAFDEQQLEETLATTDHMRAQNQEMEKQVHQLQDKYHNTHSEHAALLAAQNAARQASKKNQQGIKDWADKSRLMDVMKIEPKWQAVCDIVLNDNLSAYVLDSFDELLPLWDECKVQGESIVTLRQSSQKRASYPCLADKISGLPPASMYHLESIYAAEDLPEAKQWLPNLLDHESIVTPDGFWFGKGWAKFIKTEELDEPGFLARQQKIIDLEKQVHKLQKEIESAREKRDQIHSQLQENVRYCELFQLNLNSSNEALRINIAKLSTNEQAFETAQKQSESSALECQQLQQQLEDNADQQIQLQEALKELEQKHQRALSLQQQHADEKQSGQETEAAQQKQLTELRTVLHQLELSHDRELTKAQQYQDRIQSEQQRLTSMQEKLASLEQQSEHIVEPNKELKRQLEEFLGQHAQVDEQLTLSREQLAQFKLQLEEQDKITLNYELELKRIQEQIASNKMQEQELAVRASAVQESLDESGANAKELLADIAEDKTQNILEDEVIALSAKIKTLGAINLAAMEEFDAEQQRKNYLDEQHNDLTEALATLETAIEKMDKETRVRLEETFEQVNASFKELFPRLFGGGKAQLELTCDNLLEAGIVVMAQPPGKRNSTIHLLSGGEKAMTAVALVFAIFRLNPAPFCMLDEVDAPLDDVNVGRFCDVVKEMSQSVQFLFITHNKVTMELADHLIGVTMREPGVSRLVAVDVKQALAME